MSVSGKSGKLIGQGVVKQWGTFDLYSDHQKECPKCKDDIFSYISLGNAYELISSHWDTLWKTTEYIVRPTNFYQCPTCGYRFLTRSKFSPSSTISHWDKNQYPEVTLLGDRNTTTARQIPSSQSTKQKPSIMGQIVFSIILLVLAFLGWIYMNT